MQSFCNIHQAEKSTHIYIYIYVYVSMEVNNGKGSDSMGKKDADWMIEWFYDLSLYIYYSSPVFAFYQTRLLFYQHLFHKSKIWITLFFNSLSLSLSLFLSLSLSIYITSPLALRVKCLSMARETGVQSKF